MSSADGNTAATAAIDNRHPGSIRLPPFLEAKLKVWFDQIEEQFVICGVNTDKLRYAHMVGTLSTDTYEIASVAVTGLTDGRYQKAKQALITAYSRTQYMHYQSVLHTPPLGDQKPSVLLRGMLAELDPMEAAAPGPWICWLWFDLLPEQIRAHLLQPAMLEGAELVPLMELAVMADLCHTKDSRHVNSVAALSGQPASSGSHHAPA